MDILTPILCKQRINLFVPEVSYVSCISAGTYWCDLPMFTMAIPFSIGRRVFGPSHCLCFLMFIHNYKYRIWYIECTYRVGCMYYVLYGAVWKRIWLGMMIGHACVFIIYNKCCITHRMRHIWCVELNFTPFWCGSVVMLRCIRSTRSLSGRFMASTQAHAHNTHARPTIWFVRYTQTHSERICKNCGRSVGMECEYTTNMTHPFFNRNVCYDKINKFAKYSEIV